MARHKQLTASDHKKLGGLLSRGVPFSEARIIAEGRSRSRKPRKHTSGFGKGHSGGLSSDLSELVGFLEFVSGILTVVAILSLYKAYGFGLVGLIAVGAYLLFWEFVGAIFASVRKEVPTPLRVIIDIIEYLVEIISG